MIGILTLVQTCHWLGSNRNILSGNREVRCGFSVFLFLENPWDTFLRRNWAHKSLKKCPFRGMSWLNSISMLTQNHFDVTNILLPVWIDFFRLCAKKDSLESPGKLGNTGIKLSRVIATGVILLYYMILLQAHFKHLRLYAVFSWSKIH